MLKTISKRILLAVCSFVLLFPWQLSFAENGSRYSRSQLRSDRDDLVGFGSFASRSSSAANAEPGTEAGEDDYSFGDSATSTSSSNSSSSSTSTSSDDEEPDSSSGDDASSSSSTSSTDSDDGSSSSSSSTSSSSSSSTSSSTTSSSSSSSPPPPPASSSSSTSSSFFPSTSSSGGGGSGGGSGGGGQPPGFGDLSFLNGLLGGLVGQLLGIPGLGGGGLFGGYHGGNIPSGSSVGPGFWGSMDDLSEFFAASNNREFKGEECEDGAEGSSGENPPEATVISYISPDTNTNIHQNLVDAYGNQPGDAWFKVGDNQNFLNAITEAAKDQSGQKYIIAIACHGGPGGFLQGGINPGDITNAISRAGVKDASHILIAQGQCYPCTGGKIADALRSQGIKPPHHLRGYPNPNAVQWASVGAGGMVSHPLWRMVQWARGQQGLGAFSGRRFASAEALMNATQQSSAAGFPIHISERARRLAAQPPPYKLHDMADLLNEVLFMSKLQARWQETQPRHYYTNDWSYDD